MHLIRYRPAPPLDCFIECLWWSHRDEPLKYREHMLPSGTGQLIFALHETPMSCGSPAAPDSIAWAGSIVHGPQSSYYLAGPKPRGGAIGVAFRPGGAGALLGASMSDLAEHHVSLETLWGPRGVDLHHRLLEAAKPQEALRILELSLRRQIHRALLIHPAIAQALVLHPGDESPSARVAHVQRASGYSPRHFIALFRAAVGLKPKHYYRIRRFNFALRRLAADPGRPLGDIAALAGYADQAHLTREFRELAGIAPTQYRPQGVDRPLHHRGAALEGADGR